MSLDWKKRLARASRSWRQAAGLAPSIKPSSPVQHYFYLGPELALTRLKCGPMLYVDPQDDQISAFITAYAAWEPDVSAVVRSLLHPGARVVEIGANIGYYTMMMADAVGPRGRITALEANPRLTSLVEKSSRFNGFEDRI